jgi:SAM-dependent methyltransferase
VTATTDAYFDQQWGGSDDPWDQVGRFSEQRKYDLTVASLPRPRYRRAFEPGCATGSLSERLAQRTDALISTDRHPVAVATAARRCGSLGHVEVRLLPIPEQWPEGTFDLVVMSEILYYFDPPTLEVVLSRARHSLDPDGHLVACHFRPEVPDHAVLGGTVHQAIRDHGWRPIVEHHEASFLLDVFERP